MTSYDPLTARSPGSGADYVSSYWTATAQLPATDELPLSGTHDTDVAIVGGGYTGLSCAYHLARTYGIRATVLEANRPGWGCSGRNGGFARAAIGRYTFVRMIERWGADGARRVFSQALEALRNVRATIREGAIDCDAIDTGHLKIAHRPDRARDLEREADLLRRVFDYPAEFLTAERVRDEHIGGTESHGALRFPDALAVHPLKLAVGLLELARAAGAFVYGASPVLAIAKADGMHSLSTPTAKVRARRIVFATNGYTPEHLHRCLEGTTLPVLSHIIVTRPMSAMEKRASAFHSAHVLTDTRNLLYYWRRLPDDRILFGGRGRIGESTGSDRGQKAFLLSALKAKLPALRDITVDYDWSGWVCLTADLMPHVHHATDDASVHYAIGYQGSGVAYGLFAGKMLAQRIGEGASAEESLLPMSTPLPRFALPSLRRIAQRGVYAWYRYRDKR